jgi:hypothetical protein
MAVLANIFRFTLYENVKQFAKRNISQNKVLASLISSLVASVVTTTIVFPLEYWKIK